MDAPETQHRRASRAILTRYDRVAIEASHLVISRYSTSFSLASKLLSPGIRKHVSNIYALVRIADEIVDGEAANAGLDAAGILTTLKDLEYETERAIATGYSSNLVVHAFAKTANAARFGTELTRPFFESMRMDVAPTKYDQEQFDRYVYGSAEVVGLMCLATFVIGEKFTASELEHLTTGARRLGAAFQKVNFLRDLGEDFVALGRSYFPEVEPASFDEARKRAITDDIDADLAVAREALQKLPASSRRAVALAAALFGELNLRLRETPAPTLVSARVRVPNPVKLRIAAECALGRVPRAHSTARRVPPAHNSNN